MVDVIGRAKVIVTADVDTSSVQKSGNTIGSTLRKGALIGGAALVTLASAGVKVSLAAEEAAAQSRKLGAVLDNMGKGGAQASVEKLADQLARVSGVDDEVIKGGQTILATFSEVAKSAGDAGGAFERATKLSLDLAATGFGNVSSASKALGKALQDPEKGISALSRAGVTFTEGQKEQIKNYLETNRQAEAQNLILKEIEKQVGGTAEAGAKGSERLKTAFGEAQESLGFLLNDLFDTGKKKSIVDLAADATFRLSDAVTEFQKSSDWKQLKKDIRTYGGDLKTVAGATASIVSSLNKMSKATTGSGLVAWLTTVSKYASPLGLVADAIELIKDAVSALNQELQGDSGTVLLNPGNKNFGDSDFVDQITGNAAGTRNWRGGLTWVGEQGPELVNLPSGSDVYSNRESAAMAGGVTINNIYNGPESSAYGRKVSDWQAKHGTRFGAATTAGVPA